MSPTAVESSPHVNKNAREHFEIRTHKRLIDIQFPTQDAFMKLLRVDIPPGVGIRVQRNYEPSRIPKNTLRFLGYFWKRSKNFQ